MPTFCLELFFAAPDAIQVRTQATLVAVANNISRKIMDRIL